MPAPLAHALGLTLDVKPEHPIRIARKAPSWSINDLARKSGVTRRTIHNVELSASRYPHEWTRVRLLRALGISEDRMDAMFPDRRPPKPQPAHRPRRDPFADLHPLARARHARGYTLRALATRSGISRTSISLIENRRVNARAFTRECLLGALEIPMDRASEIFPEPKR